jgi:hypothetical protein
LITESTENIEGYSKGKLRERGEVPVSMVRYVLSNNSDRITEEIPGKYVKDPIRRLLERESSKSPLTNSCHDDNNSFLVARLVISDTAKDQISVLSKWEAELQAMKVLAADAETKLARSKSSQLEKVPT